MKSLQAALTDLARPQFNLLFEAARDFLRTERPNCPWIVHADKFFISLTSTVDGIVYLEKLDMPSRRAIFDQLRAEKKNGTPMTDTKGISRGQYPQLDKITTEFDELAVSLNALHMSCTRLMQLGERGHHRPHMFLPDALARELGGSSPNAEADVAKYLPSTTGLLFRRANLQIALWASARLLTG